MIGIYKITSPSNRIYIGQSINIKSRFGGYKRTKAKKQPRLHRSFVKYGLENHNFEILIECDVKDLNRLERYYQELYESCNKYGLNCTLTKDGDRSGVLSEDHKKNISKARKGYKSKLKGRKRDGYKKGIHRKGYTGTLLLNTETGIYYKDYYEAAFSLGISRVTLYARINRYKKSTKFIIV